MMVRNEEANLPRCLESIRGIVDEIVIVDTGSTDNTIDIARSYGAKVYEHPWQDDFSLHRNQSLDYATGDWVLIIDADEEFVMSAPIEKLKDALVSFGKKYEAVALEIIDIKQGHVSMLANTTRFFQRDKVRYEGIVHNMPVVKTQAAGLLRFCVLKHYGYDLDPEKKMAKFKRTRDLLLKRIEQDPTDYICYFYLSQIYGSIGYNRQSIEYGEKYIAHRKDVKDVFMGQIYYSMAIGYQDMQDAENCERIIKIGLEELPDDLDLHYAMVQFAKWQNRTEMLIIGAQGFYDLYQKYQNNPGNRSNRFTFTQTPHFLASCMQSLALFTFAVGIQGTKFMSDALEQTDPSMRDELLSEFDSTMAFMGLSGQEVRNASRNCI